MTNANQLVKVLSRRHAILRSLRDTPKERHVLVDYLDNSKSTVYKGVSQLEELGLIKPTSEGLQPTLFGIVALERYDELIQTAEFGELLVDLPLGAIEPSALIGAEAITPDNTSVDRHLARVETILRDVEVIRGISPAVSPEYMSLLHQRIVNGELNAEFILTTEIVTHLRQEFSGVVEDILSSSNATLYETQEEPPFTLFLASSAGSTEVVLELGGEGFATGVIINETTESLHWAETVYGQYKRTAGQVTA